MNETSAQRSAVTFELDESTGELSAILSPSPSADPVSLPLLQNRLKTEGFDALDIDAAQLKSLVSRAASGESGAVVIGQRSDAEASIAIANNKQAAYIDIVPPRGGKPLDRVTLMALFKQYGLAEPCLQNAAIDQAVRQADEGRPIKNLLIAKAVDAVAGVDGYMETLVEETAIRIGQQEEDGTVDLRQLQDFIVLEAGTELMRRIPPTPGKTGMDVLGNTIAPKAGREVKFAEKLEGAEIDAADENLLKASVKGHPVVMSNCVRIDPTLELKGVNVKSGNIQFDGSINIRGDIDSGYVVEATGDIFVTGVIDKSRVIAGGSIAVRGGVIGEEYGKSPTLNKNPEEQELKAYLEAGKDISARFVSLAEIHAAGVVYVREYLLHCKTEAKDKVALGEEGGKGAIIGGTTQATRTVSAKTLGNEAYTTTRVSAGSEDNLAAKLALLKYQRLKRRDEFRQLAEIFKKLKARGSPETVGKVVLNKARKLNNTLAALKLQVAEMDTEIEELSQQVKGEAMISARQRLYSNVTLTIDGISETRQGDCGAISFVNRDGVLTPVNP